VFLYCNHQVHKDFLITLHKTLPGRDSVVGIATRYGLYGPGIECWWGDIFYQVSFPAVKWSGRGAEVKERVELYLLSTL
jgi:hypothetical protein